MDNLPGFAYRCLNVPDWTMLFVSAGCEGLTGYTPEALINNSELSYNSIIHPDDKKKVWDTVQESLGRHRQFQLLYRIITKSGEEKWVWEQGRCIFEDDEAVAIEGLILDVAERYFPPE